MKNILTAILILISFTAFAQDLEHAADSCFDKQDYKQAFYFYGQIAPTTAKAQRRMGYIYTLSSTPGNAINFFLTAIKLDSLDKASYYYLGISYANWAKKDTTAYDKKFQALHVNLALKNLKKALQLGTSEAAGDIAEIEKNYKQNLSNR